MTGVQTCALPIYMYKYTCMYVYNYVYIDMLVCVLVWVVCKPLLDKVCGLDWKEKQQTFDVSNLYGCWGLSSNQLLFGSSI